MFDKKKIHNAFSGFIDKPAIDRIMQEPSEMENAKETVVTFALVQVRESVTGILQTISKAVDILLDADCLVESTFSTFIFATFRSVATSEVNNLENCQRVSDTLVKELGCDIRVVYGVTIGIFGSIGTRRLMKYGSLLPGMGKYMEHLMKVEYGKSERIATRSPGHDIKEPEMPTP